MMRTAKLATVSVAALATMAGGAVAAPAHASTSSSVSPAAHKATGKVVPLRQAGTGPAQWYNCGPTSMVMALLRLGIHPKGYVNHTHYVAAVKKMRKAMSPSTRHSGGYNGSNPGDVLQGLHAYKLSGKVTHVVTAMKAARHHKVAIVWGNEAAGGWKGLWAKNLLPGTTYAGHIVALVGYSKSSHKYEILDPLSKASSNKAHWVTAKQLNIYSNGAGTGPTNVVIS